MTSIWCLAGAYVLDAIGLTEMINEVIEINLAEVGSDYELVRYELPK